MANAATRNSTNRSLVARRQRIEETIEYLISALDNIDGDPDREDSDYEPSLASSNSANQTFWCEGRGDDREMDAGDQGEPEYY